MSHPNGENTCDQVPECFRKIVCQWPLRNVKSREESDQQYQDLSKHDLFAFEKVFLVDELIGKSSHLCFYENGHRVPTTNKRVADRYNISIPIPWQVGNVVSEVVRSSKMYKDVHLLLIIKALTLLTSLLRRSRKLHTKHMKMKSKL